jgi:hypothetical protein
MLAAGLCALRLTMCVPPFLSVCAFARHCPSSACFHPSFQAVRYCIDTLKESVTIWKEEHYGATLDAASPHTDHVVVVADDGGDLDLGGGSGGGAGATPAAVWKSNSEFSQATIASMNLLL